LFSGFVAKPAFAAIEAGRAATRRCNLQTAKRGRFASCKMYERRIFNENSGGCQMLGFARKLFFQPVGTPLAREFSAGRSARRKNNQNQNHMSTWTARGNWNIAKGKLKQKFAQLTDDDLQFTEGKVDELIGRIQKRTGQARKEIAHTVDEYCDCKH